MAKIPVPTDVPIGHSPALLLMPLDCGNTKMDLSMFSLARSQAAARTSLLWHPHCPIEQTVRLRDPARRHALMREAWRRGSETEDVILIGDDDALRVLAGSEVALRNAITRLEKRYGDSVVVEPPAIRYVHGACVLEPWMEVLVNAPERYCFQVECDFARRRGDIRRFALNGAAFVLEGEAPLAQLLGYADWLGDLTEATPNVATWLSRYLPIDGGPRAA